MEPGRPGSVWLDLSLAHLFPSSAGSGASCHRPPPSAAAEPRLEGRLAWPALGTSARTAHRQILRYAVLAALLPNAAWAAASRAMGTRNGEQDT
jgi:hypothetical protein